MASYQGAKATRDDEDDDAFPTKQLTILAICRFAEPIAFCSILAYTYVMVEDLQNGDNTNASFYAGLLVSAFAVAEALTAMLWGAVSDRYGRKPVVLMGLAGVAISSLLFGFAKNYWIALLARFVGGALNGNVAVMQTMVAEMVKKPEHEPKAYAVQPFVWALGSILGSAMGGFLAQPARFYPSVFSEDGIFGQYPYLLPNLVAVIVILLAMVQGIIFLDETNPLFTQNDGAIEEEDSINENTPLYRSTSLRRRSIVSRRSMMSRQSIAEGLREMAQEVRRKPSFLQEGLPTTTEPNFDIRRSSFGTIYSIQRAPVAAAGRGRLGPVTHQPTDKTFNYSVIMMTVALVLISYHQMAFQSMLPVYLLDNPHSRGLDLKGGLGYTVHDVGVYMAVNGVIALIVQGVIFPVFVEKIGVWKSFFWLVVFYPISYIVMPFLSIIPSAGVPAGIYCTLALQNFFAIIVYPCALILLKNACPSPLVLGKVNGLAMSSCCGARTFSPPIAGIMYSVGGSAAGWWSLAAVSFAGVVQLFWIPREPVDKVVAKIAFKQDNVLEAPILPAESAIED